MAIFASIVLSCGLRDIAAVPILFHLNLFEKTVYEIPFDFAIDTCMYYMAKKTYDS